MIGVFDSGVGGLAILAEIRRQLPSAAVTYLADTAAFPYGNKSPEFVIERCEKITHLIVGRGANVVVLACNTATIVAIEHLRGRFAEIPFVGVEPAIKVAVAKSNARIKEPIHVLMTANTAAGGKYAALVERHAAGRRVHPVVIDMLAPAVEDGSYRRPEVAAEIQRQVKAELGELPPGSQVVLGCTHYIFLKDLLRQTLGPDVEILEPGEAVARQVGRVARQRNLEIESGNGELSLLCTAAGGVSESFAATLDLPACQHVSL
jgi:glutamate racemase